MASAGLCLGMHLQAHTEASHMYMCTHTRTHTHTNTYTQVSHTNTHTQVCVKLFRHFNLFIQHLVDKYIQLQSTYSIPETPFLQTF